MLHGRAGCNYPIEIINNILLPSQVVDLIPEALVFKSFVDRQLDPRSGIGLGNEVNRAGLHRLDDELRRPEWTGNDQGRVGKDPSQLFQSLDPI